MYLLEPDGDASKLARWLRPELNLERILRSGCRGTAVRRVQEWLNLHGEGLAIDSLFGPVTAGVVSRFQERAGLPRTGVVEQSTFEVLSDPLRRALRPQATNPATFAEGVLERARLHLAPHPREVGGQNAGPWVRLYMRGHEGPDWPWCAGFLTFLLKQSSEATGLLPPIEGSFSCDVLGMQAATAGLLIREGARHGAVPAGSLFLVRRTASDWTHAGLVTGSTTESFETIEGNTNDSGHREGFEVCARTRGYRGKDFIRIP